MRFLAAEGKYITFSRCIECSVPFSSLIVNCTVPTPSAIELPATPLTPMVVDFTMEVKSSSWEQMWWVAQLSVPKLVGALVESREQRLVEAVGVAELARTMTSETSMASVARHRGCEEDDNAVLLLLFLSGVLCTGESDNGSDADLSLGERMSGVLVARQMG